MQDLKKVRTRCFCAVLYEEMLINTMNYIRSGVDSGSIEFYAIIKHSPDDDCQQYHWHLLIYMANPSDCERMCRNFGVRNGIVQVCKKKYKYSAYLLHRGYPDKKQYDISEVECNDYEKFAEWVEKGSRELSEREMLKLFHTMAYEGQSLHSILFTLMNDESISPNTIRKYAFYFRIFYQSFVND